MPVIVLTTCFFGVSIFLFQLVKSDNTDIVITEIGAYESNDHEWIEIYNKGDVAVSIEGWKFLVEGESEHGINLGSTTDFMLEPQSFVIIAENYANFLVDYPEFTGKLFDSSWGGINEDGSKKIGLKTQDGVTIEFFNYPSAPNFSLERKDVSINAIDLDNWKEHPDGNTVGKKNFWAVQKDSGDGGEDLPAENSPPTAFIESINTTTLGTAIVFDGSGSRDPDEDVLMYTWKTDEAVIGDSVQVTYMFSTTGTFSIFLTVADTSGASSTVYKEITIVEVSDALNSLTVSSTDSNLRIVINEFVSDPVAGEKEWIELYNASTSSLDLTGWELYEGAGKIATLNSVLDSASFVVVSVSGTSKLNNGGDVIILKNTRGDVVDSVAYGYWIDETHTDASHNAPAASDPNSVARIVDGQDTGNDKNDFAITTQLTPSETNVIVAPAADKPPSSSGGGSTPSTLPPAQKSYESGSVVVNELVSDPSDELEEFIELYNKTTQLIDLTNWYVEDGSETKTMLEGSISSKEFFVLEKPKGSLNNSGDIVILFDPSGKEMDRVTYGLWDDGNVSDNAPAAKDPLSLIRKVDGQDANNDYYDFVLTSTLTKGKANIISGVTKDGEIIEQIVGVSTVQISEVYPNPPGSDTEDEFIELKNVGKETINLTGWKLGDSSAKRYTIAQGSVSPGSYIVFKRSMTGIALNNTGGDEVKLYAPSGALIDSVHYPGSASEDLSYVRREDGSWVWTTQITSGKQNIVEGKSVAPIITIETETEVAVNEWVTFDASDSTDPDGAALTFSWDFGDGAAEDGSLVQHKFSVEGVYSVVLKVSNGSKESKKSVSLTVKLASDFVGGYAGVSDVTRILISEILPNPEGSDTTEFIELFNPSDADIDVSFIKLDDEEGGSRAYTIPEGTLILAGEYKVFGRQDSKLALNNTSDSVRVLYPDGTVISEVRFDDVVEGASYVRNDEGIWVWTTETTPGSANSIIEVAHVKGTKISKKSTYVAPRIETNLFKLRSEDIGDQVKVTGIVAVEPGVLGTQYFYLIDERKNASSSEYAGVQVYMYKKDFPKLEVGDRVEVSGELAESGSEARIKTSEKKDIVKIDHPGELLPYVVDIADIGEAFEGHLILVNGEITELKGSYMYVDDGSEEIKVYFKSGAGIQKNLLQEGNILTVAGLVHQTKTEFQLLPRSPHDITKTGVSEDFVFKVENQESNASQDMAEKYLTATAGGLTAIFVGLLGKSHGARLIAFISSLLDRIRRKK